MNQQTTLQFKLPRPGELFKYGSQNYQLYEALYRHGRITNVAIRDLYIMSHTRRISDVREKLKPFCMDIKKEPVGAGVYSYYIAGAN